MDNKTYSAGLLSNDAPLLTVSGTAAFGGIEVKN
jgi:hypothetical protein